MEIKIIIDPRTSTITLKGSLDISNAAVFEEQFKKIASHKPRAVGIDLNEVDNIDSSGIGAVVKMYNLLKNSGGEFILYGMNSRIMTVFQGAGLYRFFKILTNEEFQKKYLVSG